MRIFGPHNRILALDFILNRNGSNRKKKGKKKKEKEKRSLLMINYLYPLPPLHFPSSKRTLKLKAFSHIQFFLASCVKNML